MKLMVFPTNTESWCIHNLNLNKILIACKFTVCKFENSQSETNNSIYWLVHDYESTSFAFFGLLIGREELIFSSPGVRCVMHFRMALQKTKERHSRVLHHVQIINLLLQISDFLSAVCYITKQKNIIGNFVIHSNMIIQECARARWIYLSVRLAGSWN